MVTKRYIKKGEKKFGPYYYESYRDHTGKVKKRYIKDYKPSKEPHKKITNFLLILGILTLVMVLLGLITQQPLGRTLSGKTVFIGKEIYSPNELLTGEILFNLKAGESIPKDTIVSITLGNTEEEFILSDFVDYEPVQGEIYAENSDLLGEGLVYGIPGVKKTYQTVSFELEVYEEVEQDESSSGEISESPPEEEDQTETTEESSEESQESEESTDTEEESDDGSVITGEVISETENIIKTINGEA
ncbi:MAG: hypothetical protein ABIH92_04340, partial [Nanoarchaeota archaeon]